MAKQAKSVKASTPAPAAPVSRTRAPAYPATATITVVTGEGQRRVVKGLACERALNAMVDSKGKARTVQAFIDAFGPLCVAKPMPGRAGQPGHVQAAAMLRFLEREGAVTVK